MHRNKKTKLGIKIKRLSYMPTCPHPNFVRTWMQKWMLWLGLSSWLKASLYFVSGFYAIFLIIAILDGTLTHFTDGREWWESLLFPIVLLYLLAIMVPLQQLLSKIIAKWQLQLPKNNVTFKQESNDVYILNRRHEKIVFAMGVIGYLLFKSYHPISPSIIFYQLVGGSLVTGLFMWYLYFAISRTKRIVMFHQKMKRILGDDNLIIDESLMAWTKLLIRMLLFIVIITLPFVDTILSVTPIVAYTAILFTIWRIINLSHLSHLSILPQLKKYCTVPKPPMPTLLDDLMTMWMDEIGTSSYFVATIIFTMMCYVIFLFIWLIGGQLETLKQNFRWTLMFPVIMTYLLLMPLMWRIVLYRTIYAYQDTITSQNRFKMLVQKVYTLNRQHEWFAMIVGVVGIWLLFPPWIANSFADLVFNIVGHGINGALLGYLIYSTIILTRNLAKFYDELQQVSIFGRSLSILPTLQWSVVLAVLWLITIFLSTLFVPDWLNPANLAVYIMLLLTIIIIFVSNRVPYQVLPWFRVLRIAGLFFAVATVGTYGFLILEKEANSLTLVDAVYMTVITMTTIGYGDMTPITQNGRIFTVFLSLFAVGIGGYAISASASFIIEGDLSDLLKGKKMSNKIAKLKDHCIICGVGKTGRQIALEFYKTQVPFVFIESSEHVIKELLHLGDFLYIHGDATKDETLYAARIEHAKGLITCLPDDTDNAFIVLSARSLNQNLRIISRLSDEENETKLWKVGADEIVSPHVIGGLRMASVMLRPTVVTFLDQMLRAEKETGEILRVEEIPVSRLQIPELIGRDDLTVRDIGHYSDLLIIAVKLEDETYQFKPRGNTFLDRGDTLIAVGSPDDMAYVCGEY